VELYKKLKKERGFKDSSGFRVSDGEVKEEYVRLLEMEDENEKEAN